MDILLHFAIGEHPICPKKCLKRISKNEKPELPRRCVSNLDQDVFDYALEDACAEVANVKSLRKGSRWMRGGGVQDATKCPQKHPVCNVLFSGEGRGGEGTSNKSRMYRG